MLSISNSNLNSKGMNNSEKFLLLRILPGIEFAKEYNFDVENKEKINYKFIYIDKIISDIYTNYENDKEYISNFIFYLYNYERYFILKKGREMKK